MENMKIHLSLWLSKTWSTGIYSGNLNYRRGTHYTKLITGFSVAHSSIQSHAHDNSISQQSQTAASSSWTRFSSLLELKKSKKKKLYLRQSNLNQTVKTITKLLIHTDERSALQFCAEWTQLCQKKKRVDLISNQRRREKFGCGSWRALPPSAVFV